MKTRSNSFINKTEVINTEVHTFLNDIENEENKKYKILLIKDLFKFLIKNKYYVKHINSFKNKKEKTNDFTFLEMLEKKMIDIINDIYDNIEDNCHTKYEKETLNYLYYFKHKFF